MELIKKVKNVDQIAGVIAHEIGHLKGGHLNKRLNESKSSLLNSVLSGILAAGAIAAGSATLTCSDNIAVNGAVGNVAFDIVSTQDSTPLTGQTGYNVTAGT